MNTDPIDADDEIGALKEAIERARCHSPFLGRLIEAESDLVEIVAGEGMAAGWSALQRRANPDDDVRRSLRRERAGTAMLAALGDLAGIDDFVSVTRRLAGFADRALQAAVENGVRRYCDHGGDVRGFSALALGKHGSGELNYSSDIDLLFLFDPAKLVGAGDPQKIAVRIGRELVDILQERTADGYVFRVDLRLRPSPEVTPIALPVSAAIAHYESYAEPWERAAFIRARAVAGDLQLGEQFLDAIAPFVWRRALDFGAIGEIRSISRRIRDHYGKVQHFEPGYDLKRGRGGIREIEFFAQIHQLIHGGREPELRAPATLDALEALGTAGHIDGEVAMRLAENYRLFRTIEHRLQMVEDQQTHSLPRQAAALDNVAQLHGLKTGADLLGLLSGPVVYVGDRYDTLLADDGDRLPVDTAALEEALQAAGFEQPQDARRRIEGWRAGKRPTTRTPVAREALEAVLPELIAGFGSAPDPIGAINRFDGLLASLPSAVNFFRLLEARPGLVEQLVDILSHAPALADDLARRAELFDGLIDATALDLPESVDELANDLQRRAAAEDYQDRLDRMRQLVGEERFALGVQLIEGVGDPLDVAAGYSRVAEAALAVLTDDTVAEFEAQHGTVPDSEFVILALGRLGGEALTHASDLDLVYLFTGRHGAMSDGRRPLDGTRYYQRLAQRATAALSVPTAAGPLYDVDTRLRPSGGQGLLAVSLDSFAAYHRDSAWTWEHMALARARPVYGSSGARAATADIIARTLARGRDPAMVARDAAAMRAEMAAHKPPAGPLDVKLVDGGLVDLEFCVHVTQLQHCAGFNPYLPAAIEALAAEGLVPEKLGNAHDLLTRMLVTLRLVSPASTDVPERSREIVARACRARNWEELVEAYDAARHCVADHWTRLTSDFEGDTI